MHDVVPACESDRLTPFHGPKLVEGTDAFRDALHRWLGTDARFVITPSRQVSAGTKGPSTIEVAAPSGAKLTLRLHSDEAVRGWKAGPITFTVVRDTTDPTADRALRGVLRHLGGIFASVDPADLASRGEALSKLHHAWAVLASMDDRFYRHLERAHSGYTGLLRTGFTCNQDCHFCPEGRDWPNPPDDLVFQWLDEIAAAGATRLNLCGGEPTLWRRLPELIERARRRHGLAVHMNTNGIKLRLPGYAAKLRASGLSSVLVSFHAADPTISDAITRAPGTHRRTVEGIHAALDAGLFVILNCCVDRKNVDHLPEHARFVREQFVEGRADNPVRMVNYSQPGKYYDFDAYLHELVDYERARPMLARAARTLGDAGVLLEIAGTCGFPSCVVRDVADLVPWRATTAMDAHHRSARVHDPKPCQSCAAFDQCIGPRREYLDVHGEKGLVPYDRVPSSDWYDRLSTLAIGANWEGLPAA